MAGYHFIEVLKYIAW